MSEVFSEYSLLFQDSQPYERVPDEWTGCGSTGIVNKSLCTCKYLAKLPRADIAAMSDVRH